MLILGLSNKNLNVRDSYSYVAMATKIRFNFQFPRSPDAAFGGHIGWLINWKFNFGCRIIKNIANYVKYNHFVMMMASMISSCDFENFRVLIKTHCWHQG